MKKVSLVSVSSLLFEYKSKNSVDLHRAPIPDVLRIWIVGAIDLETVLQQVQLPGAGAQLNTGLADVKMQNLSPHRENSVPVLNGCT